MRKSLTPKAEAKKRKVVIVIRMKPREPAKYSKYFRSSRYTLWKARRVRILSCFSKRAG